MEIKIIPANLKILYSITSYRLLLNQIYAVKKTKIISLKSYLLSILERRDGPKKHMIIDISLIHLSITTAYVSIEISTNMNFLKRLVNHFGLGKKMRLSAFGKRIFRMRLPILFLFKLSDFIQLGFQSVQRTP